MSARHWRARHFLARHFLAIGAPPDGSFSETVKAYLEGRKVNFRLLVAFDFRDGVERVWGGEYALTSGGETWKGLGRITNIEGLDQEAGLESSVMTFTLSGVELPGADLSYLAIATSEDRSNYVDRLVTVYIQFFEIEDDPPNNRYEWHPLDDPYAIKAGIMTGVTVSRSRVQTKQGQGVLRTVSLQANNIFYGRSVARGAFYTDRDQQIRAPGDKGMQFIVALQDREIEVPWR